MRIFDQYDHLLETADKSRGYLKRDSRFLCRHPAVEAVAGKGHYKTVKEYPNGGKDVAWVVDVPSVEARQAWDEYEEILRFVPYTADQLAQRRIAELKESLQSTDYLILKVVEGAATLAEIGEAIKQRAAWRREIKELEKTYEKDISVPL